MLESATLREIQKPGGYLIEKRILMTQIFIVITPDFVNFISLGGEKTPKKCGKYM